MDIVKRVDLAVAYMRSFFDDPALRKKASMVRACAFLSCITACYCAVKTVQFAFANHDAIGMAGVLTGLVTTLAATVCGGLLMRKKSESAEPEQPETPTAPAPQLPIERGGT